MLSSGGSFRHARYVRRGHKSGSGTGRVSPDPHASRPVRVAPGREVATGYGRPPTGPGWGSPGSPGPSSGRRAAPRPRPAGRAGPRRSPGRRRPEQRRQRRAEREHAADHDPGHRSAVGQPAPPDAEQQQRRERRRGDREGSAMVCAKSSRTITRASTMGTNPATCAAMRKSPRRPGRTSLESTPATESSSPAETASSVVATPAATSPPRTTPGQPAQRERGQQQDGGVALAADQQLRCAEAGQRSEHDRDDAERPRAARGRAPCVRRAARPSGLV